MADHYATSTEYEEVENFQGHIFDLNVSCFRMSLEFVALNISPVYCPKDKDQCLKQLSWPQYF